MAVALIEARKKIYQNAKQGRRTLLVFFYAGHGANKSYLNVLFNSNKQNHLGNIEYGDYINLNLESLLRDCAELAGAYVIGLLACDRTEWPKERIYLEEEVEEETGLRGGTDNQPIVPQPIADPGQSIYIYAVPYDD